MAPGPAVHGSDPPMGIGRGVSTQDWEAVTSGEELDSGMRLASHLDIVSPLTRKESKCAASERSPL